MKRKLIIWLLSLLQPAYTRAQVKQINQFKSLFRTYFEGGYDFDAAYPMSITSLGITDLIFVFNGRLLLVTVVLERPGLLIGKAGIVIDDLNKYLATMNIVVGIKESKLWRFLK